jgi:hypothetical protein
MAAIGGVIGRLPVATHADHGAQTLRVAVRGTVYVSPITYYGAKFIEEGLLATVRERVCHPAQLSSRPP